MHHRTLRNALILLLMAALFVPSIAVLAFMGFSAADFGNYAMATTAAAMVLFMAYSFIIIAHEVLR